MFQSVLLEKFSNVRRRVGRFEVVDPRQVIAWAIGLQMSSMNRRAVRSCRLNGRRLPAKGVRLAVFVAEFNTVVHGSNMSEARQ